MQETGEFRIATEELSLESKWLGRVVKTDLYIPDAAFTGACSLLLVNDGQDFDKMGFLSILDELYRHESLKPLLCAGIHCGTERKMEYGVPGLPDYKGRGAKADFYSRFIFEELLPAIDKIRPLYSFNDISFAGFSLGGLSALSIAWARPDVFKRAGVFSGSLWWRSMDQEDPLYDDKKHRIMHQVVREGVFRPGMEFFFQCGNMDEVKDRNNNGIIDSIDDTLDLIKELEAKGYAESKDIQYLEIADGKHDVATWARAMPEFLKWGWGK